MNRLIAVLLAALCALVVHPALAQQRINLWPNGAPGFESRKDIPERTESYWVRDVNNPSITVFPARGAERTRTAVLIMPGGGHEFLVITSEGDDVARWFADRGVTAFVLRYRLFMAPGTPYRLEHSRQDAERAMRLIRSRAGEFGFDANRLGVVGFSAGAELARLTLLSDSVPAPGPGDAIDTLSSIPDFGILAFPGDLRVPETITANSPPLLLSAANDDECCSQPVVDLLIAYRKAGASAELHMYAAGGHAYNMGENSALLSLQHWPDRIVDWMTDRGLLTPE